MYDILIIGAGHAGIEAAHIASKLNNKVALLSMSKNDIGSLPCNVSIGGSAKGIVVKEIFALGGLMPLAADETQLQTKILNQSKGPAVHALRAQIDKIQYPKFMSKKILNDKNIDFIETEVKSLIIAGKRVNGVKLSNGDIIKSKTVIITTGTFLRSKTMKGKEIIVEGPDGKTSSFGISEQLEKNGFKLIRLKTGTPPRIKKDTINFKELEIEPGSKEPIYFTENIKLKKKYQNTPAWLAYTNKEAHKIIENNFDKSYLFSDEISGTGPRYCPSIEDKVKRFNDKDRHQIFLELESESLDSIYLAGLSSSMPKEVQEEFIKKIKGFKKAEFLKYAYAIEYDAIDPLQLHQTLESKILSNLYFAGQINGTSGYEEAAAQGLIASINANNKIKKIDPFILGRDEAYIGVMIDDITTKGIHDPYRLLSSRAEYRLLLRNDNATKRLFQKSYDNKLITTKQYNSFFLRFENQKKLIEYIRNFKVKKEEVKKQLKKFKIEIQESSFKLIDLIKRPEFSIFDFNDLLREKIESFNISNLDLETINIEIKFEGYILKQQREIEKYQKYQKYFIPTNIIYSSVPNLSKESTEKLAKFKPTTIYQASNISGINPSDIMALIYYLKEK